MIGSTVVNDANVTDANVTVGTTDDLIITANEKVPFVGLSVGGFLEKRR